MPSKPKKPCRKQGCTNLVENGYCEKHRKESWARDSRRESASKRGYDHRWKKARHEFLVRNPLCKTCLRNGRVEPATDVDHVIPHRGDQKLFWDIQNWQSLCHSCHSKKTNSGQ